MSKILFTTGPLEKKYQETLSAGFEIHSKERSSPAYQKDRINWLVIEENDQLVGVLTADVFWDWIYIDELWIDRDFRGRGLGKVLMGKAEEYAISQKMIGLWLWTQSWQAPEFYLQLGYQEFARFADFPIGHNRIGYRKQISLKQD